MTQRTLLTLCTTATLATGLLAATGCSASKARPSAARPLTSSGTAQPSPQAIAQAAVSSGDAGNTAAPADNAPPTGVEHREPIDALITHIAGEPMFASQILIENEGSLRSMASQTTPAEFRQRAFASLEGSVMQYVLNNLAVAEAQSTLTEREEQYIAGLMNYRKQELIRQYGEGSLIVAEARIQEVHGMSLNEFMRINVRERRLVDMYLQKTLDPLVNVTRRDIERYYKEHPELFNPDPKFIVRRIRVGTEAEATEIKEQLDAGKPFEEVASNEINQTSPDQGGLWSDGDPINPGVFRFTGLNDAYAGLDDNEWAGPLEETLANDRKRYWFVYVDDKIGGVSRPLVEAQDAIHNTLVDEQKRLYQARINQRLFRRASITNSDLRNYTAQIVEIAVARYGPELNGPTQ